MFAKFDGKCLWEKLPLVCIAGRDMPKRPPVCRCINLNSTLAPCACQWFHLEQHVQLWDRSNIRLLSDLERGLGLVQVNGQIHLYPGWAKHYWHPTEISSQKANASIYLQMQHRSENTAQVLSLKVPVSVQIHIGLLECCDRAATKEVCRLLQDSSDPLLLFFQIDLAAGDQHPWVFKC